MEMKKKILLIYTNYSSFVNADYEILTSEYEVAKYQFKPVKGLIKNACQFLKQLIFLLFKAWKYDGFFIWFTDYHSILPVLYAQLFSKKSYLIVGGFDAVNIPEIQFGVFYKEGLRSKIVKVCYKNANYILPVDSSLIQSTNYYSNQEGQQIGFMNYVDKVDGKVITIPTGYNPEKWKREPLEIRRNVITVGGCNNMQSYLRKGHDLFVEVARAMPDVKFTLIGIGDDIRDQVISNPPANLEVFGFLSQEEIIKQFSLHKVFTQFSLSEGLPNTLCEAMLCGCIPVGSNVNGIPDAIGKQGYILSKPDIKLAVEKINDALKEDQVKPEEVRQRIIDLYTFDRRKKAILGIIN